MKLTRQFYYYLAQKLIDRFDLNIFPNQLVELLDNWIWRWNQKKKIGCGEYFQHGVGEFVCGGGLYVNGKKKLCPKCEKGLQTIGRVTK